MSFYARHIGPRLIGCACSMRQIAAERARLVPLAEGRVLEIGIGPGHNLAHYDPSRVTMVVGVDPIAAFVQLGATARLRSPVPVEMHEAPAERLPLPDGSIDTAVITCTLCSVDDPAQALREVRRVLRPQGTVLLLEHGRSPDTGVARWQDRLNPLWRRLAVGCNLNRPVVGLVREAGFAFRSLEQSYLPGAPRPVGWFTRGVAAPVAA